MKITPQLKNWLVEHKGLSADSSDDDFAKAATDAMLDESLSATQFAELSKDVDAEPANALVSALSKLNDRIGSLEDRLVQGSGPAPAEPKSEPVPATKERSAFDRMLAESEPATLPVSEPSATSVRQVGVDEKFSTTKSALTYPTKTRGGRGAHHPFGGSPVVVDGRQIDTLSDLERAVCGAYAKYSIAISAGGRAVPKQLQMTELDKQLMDYALHEMEWTGVLHGVGSEDSGAKGIDRQKLDDAQVKALIDDGGASGALEMAPIVFDDAIITTPLLHSEFFPRVEVVNITRGRRIEGASIANVTLNSGGVDGTNIDLENTASFISAFDTNIYVVDGAIEIGLDFLSDSPVDVGALITTSYGEQLLTWLDTQIVGGDGTTEPQGILNASGTVSVSSDNGVGGGPTVGDYESLLFGVTKAFRAGTATNRVAFGANETTYSRARGIAVGASDERRVFGMTHEDYMLLGHPFGISESFTNPQSLFANFASYRLYRRLGLTVRATTEGQTLVRQNMMMISARSRWGGQLTLGNAAAIITDGQS